MQRSYWRHCWWGVAAAGGLGAYVLLAPRIGGEELLAPIVNRHADRAEDAAHDSRVAERIDLDPSIRETPSLPAERKTDAAQIVEPQAGASGRAQAHLDDEGETGAKGHLDDAEETPESAADRAWPEPASLIAQLDRLAETDPLTADWVGSTKAELETLALLPSLADTAAERSFQRLSELAEEAKALARRGEDDDARSRILRAGFAVVRRIAIWEPVHQVAVRDAAGQTSSPQLSPPGEILSRLRFVEPELATGRDPQAWRKYLLLDQLMQKCTSGGSISPAEQQLARDFLYRFHSTQLSEAQATMLEKPVYKNLAQALQTWANESVDLKQLATTIEQYESDERVIHSVALADKYDILRWSQDESTAELADAINSYYRNANVRVAISAELVNRLLPKEMRTVEPVVDRIQGADVEGQSETSTQLRLVLLPNRRAWDIGLEAKGEVASSTSSRSGPATFFQDGAAYYRARKLLTVDRKSIRMHRAEAEAAAESQLNDFETDYDHIPLFNILARAIAKNQYDQKSPAARQEVEGKIIYRATSTLDQQVAQRLEKARQDFQAKLLTQLQQLQLDPTAVDMETTQERLIARYRLAGREQLAAHTPRPQAPGDSLLSVQVHETALNNALEHLRLSGRKIELHDLFKEMTSRFAERNIPVPEDLPDGVFVTFADHDPVRIDCEDGRLRLVIQLKELSATGEGKSWKNLIVKGYYKPHPDQLDANLVRDGIIELGGNRLRTGDRLALAGIFEKVLSRNRKLNLVNERISNSPQLQDQQVTQFVIHDGWIGIALGPQLPNRTAQQTKIPPR